MSDAFQIVVLGCSGGPNENNLSGYLFSPLNTDEWFALDGGSLLHGIDLALQRRSLVSVSFQNQTLTPSAEMLIEHIRGFFISHAHLDHLAALVINSQVDEHKYILGIDPTINNIRDHIFNGRIWPNYGNEGVEPILSKYTYVRLPLHKKTEVPNSSMNVEAFLLSHPRGYPSTAFLIERNDEYFLYFGDTSSDSLEIEKHLARIWRRITPLLKEKKLHGMLLECSFAHAEAHQAIYGHLDTKLMMKELHHLASISNASLDNFPVIVTHRKEQIHAGYDDGGEIERELNSFNDLGVRFIFPTQGERILI